MTDKEKIKFWTKGRLFEIMNGIGENDAKNILTELLSFIDSMQEQSVSKDLEEAIGQSFIYHENRGDDFRSDKQIETAYRYGFETGANWQKQMTMKDALDGYYGAFYNHVFIDYDCRKLHLADGQKLKILIIKED